MLIKRKLPKLSLILLSAGLSASLTTLVNAAAAPETPVEPAAGASAPAGATCASPALDAGPKMAECESPVLDAGPRLAEPVATAAELATLAAGAKILADSHSNRIDEVMGLVNQHAPIINTHDSAINNHKTHIDRHAEIINAHEKRIAALEQELRLRPTFNRMAIAVSVGATAAVVADRAIRDGRCTIQ